MTTCFTEAHNLDKPQQTKKYVIGIVQTQEKKQSEQKTQ